MKKFLKSYAFILSSLLLLAGCMGNMDQRIKMDGSVTVLAITQAVVEDFAQAYPGTEIAVSGSGTGGGFKKFVNNEIDIQNASRKISQREIEAAEANDVSYYELSIAKDAIIVAVNKSNTWVTNLTEQQLYDIFKADSEIETWADINPNWPQTNINFYVPALDSGTFDYFHSKVMKETTDIRADVTASQDLNVLVTGVEGDKDALGFFSYAYYQAAREKVSVVNINDITPDPASIVSDVYPLARDLYIYVNKDKYETKSVLQQFVAYYMDNVASLADEVGFIPLSNVAYERERDKLTAV